MFVVFVVLGSFVALCLAVAFHCFLFALFFKSIRMVYFTVFLFVGACLFLFVVLRLLGVCLCSLRLLVFGLCMLCKSMDICFWNLSLPIATPLQRERTFDGE